jgi:thiamine monophosphate synthase
MQATRKGLYAVTPDWDDTARLLAASDAALRGGAAVLQYRHKSADEALRRENGQPLAAAGADMAAVISSVYFADDPESAAPRQPFSSYSLMQSIHPRSTN